MKRTILALIMGLCMFSWTGYADHHDDECQEQECQEQECQEQECEEQECQEQECQEQECQEQECQEQQAQLVSLLFDHHDEDCDEDECQEQECQEQECQEQEGRVDQDEEEEEEVTTKTRAYDIKGQWRDHRGNKNTYKAVSTFTATRVAGKVTEVAYNWKGEVVVKEDEVETMDETVKLVHKGRGFLDIKDAKGTTIGHGRCNKWTRAVVCRLTTNTKAGSSNETLRFRKDGTIKTSGYMMVTEDGKTTRISYRGKGKIRK